MTGGGRREIKTMFAMARTEDRAVLLPYLTAGLPTLDDSVELFVAMAEAGADGFEVGIPYADPLMDGPVIMRAGELALDSGMTVERSLEVVRRVRERTGKPILVMTYVNPVLRHGIDDFFDRVADAGGSGVIIADLPVDESEPFVDAACARGLGMVQFAAPTTDHDRLEAIAALDPVFVYAIAEVGVTGERDGASTRIEALASAIRRVTQAPIVFGVGISTPEQAADAARHGDGVIVGTAIVRRVLDAPSAGDARCALVGAVEELATSVRRG
jgi:tryptophan synthase alpha chain